MMKRILSLALVLILALSCFCLQAFSEGETQYRYYVQLSGHALKVFIDPAWESLALEGKIRYALEEDDDTGAIAFFYTEEEEMKPLFTVSVRKSDVSYLPENCETAVWSKTHGEWNVELFVLASAGGFEYDCVIDSLSAPERMIEFLTADEKWNFAVKDIYGNDVLAKDALIGNKITMVNVWATYCSPCIQEMPALGELSREYAEKGLVIVGVVSDVYEGQDAEYACMIAEETGADYLHVTVNNDIGMALLSGVQYVPTTFFLNEQGQVIDSHVGSLDKAGWAAIFEELLSE